MKHRLLIIFALSLIPGLSQAGFVHPMNFTGTDAQKQEVIEFIKARVKHDYCESGLDMCQPTTLRMMEKKNLEAFKAITQAKNRAVMDGVIHDYCNSGVDMCSYTTIRMMYEKNLKASGEELTW